MDPIFLRHLVIWIICLAIILAGSIWALLFTFFWREKLGKHLSGNIKIQLTQTMRKNARSHPRKIDKLFRRLAFLSPQPDSACRCKGSRLIPLIIFPVHLLFVAVTWNTIKQGKSFEANGGGPKENANNCLAPPYWCKLPPPPPHHEWSLFLLRIWLDFRTWLNLLPCLFFWANNKSAFRSTFFFSDNDSFLFLKYFEFYFLGK